MQPAGRVPAGHGHGCYNAVCERIGYHKCRLIWPQPTANVASHPQFYALSPSRLHERDPVSSEDVDGITRNGSARRRQSGVAILPAALPLEPLGPAAIRLVLPNSAPAGALVALVGINLPVAGTVHFGPTNISIASLDTRTPRTMVVEVPPGSPGAVQIEVAGAERPLRGSQQGSRKARIGASGGGVAGEVAATAAERVVASARTDSGGGKAKHAPPLAKAVVDVVALKLSVALF
jgi:hypothetical protein